MLFKERRGKIGEGKMYLLNTRGVAAFFLKPLSSGLTKIWFELSSCNRIF